MEGFEKIDLGTTRSRLKRSTIINSQPVFKKKMKTNIFKKLLTIIGILAVILIIFGLILIAPLKNVYTDAKATYAQVKITADALKKEDIAQTSI